MIKLERERCLSLFVHNLNGNFFPFFCLQNQISNSKLIANTLLELYIKNISESAKNTNDNNKKKDLIDHAINESADDLTEKVLSLQERKALEFLTSSSSYDINLALVICQLHNFKVYFLLF